MYIIGHQGWTDFFSQFGLYIHMYRKYGKATVLVVNPTQLPFVKRLFLDTGVDVEIAQTTSIGSGTCVICHQTGNPFSCPRTGQPCQYIVGSFIGLCAFDNYTKWASFRESCTLSFAEAFYLYHGISPSAMYDNFIVKRTPETERIDLSNVPYITYHTQPSFPLRLPMGYAVPLDNSSEDFFKSISIIEGAKEIHLLQSSYCMFIYLLQLKYGLFADKQIFVHAYARHNANTDYRNLNRHPQLPNWTFL
jgi:hypothetical protein